MIAIQVAVVMAPYFLVAYAIVWLAGDGDKS